MVGARRRAGVEALVGACGLCGLWRLKDLFFFLEAHTCSKIA